MGGIRYLTSGESHGQGLIGIIEGLPAGLNICEEDIFKDLQRRQLGHGRGGRMKIETDRAQIISGVRFGKTLGSPVSLLIENADWKNWTTKMSTSEVEEAVKAVEIPRPGHADLAGAIKYRAGDIRDILERASARETAMRVALAALAKKFLGNFGIKIVSHVTRIHTAENPFSVATMRHDDKLDFTLESINDIADASSVRSLDKAAEEKMIADIDAAKEQKDTVGGVFEVIALNLPIGLGSHIQWDRKLDGRIGQAMMSIPAMKGVEIGMGFETGAKLGSQVHDPIYYNEATKKYYRSTNHAGGLEAGITNGEPLVIRVAMKPISTLMNPLDSVNMKTKEKTAAHIERSDTCAVPAAAVIGESLLALVLADAFLEKFGGDSMSEVLESYERWQDRDV